MNLLEVVYVEWLEETWGNVYDKPYISGGVARHIIGRWDVRRRWMQGTVPMASFDVTLDGKPPVRGWGKRRTDRDGRLHVYDAVASGIIPYYGLPPSWERHSDRGKNVYLTSSSGKRYTSPLYNDGAT